jgi:hypothetical protein
LAALAGSARDLSVSDRQTRGGSTGLATPPKIGRERRRSSRAVFAFS